jgi:hypothetical protein
MKYFILILFLMLCIYSSCTYEKVEPASLKCTPPDSVSFSGDIQPIFNAHCIDGGCHSGSSPGGHLDLTASLSYGQLMASGSGYVDTLIPKYSLLYAQMNSVSNPMPPSGKMDKCTLQLVLKWIQQKAKNN